MRTTRLIVIACALLPLVAAVLALVGMAFGLPGLVSVRPEFRAMSSVTASCLLLLSVGVLACEFGRERVAAGLGVAAGLLAGAVLISYLGSSADNISPWWSQLILPVAGGGGRTSKSTAVALVLLALPILLPRRQRLADWSAGAALVLASFGLLGYAYGVAELYANSLFNNMALHTAGAVFLLAISALCLRPGLGWSGVVASSFEAGGAARRQLAFLLFPPLLGWLLARAVESKQLGTGAGMGIFVIATVLPIALLVLRDGRAQIALDQRKRDEEARLADIASDAARLLARQADQLRAEAEERARVDAAISRSQRLESVGQLTGGIAHDFNNLLMRISGNAQLLKRKIAADDPSAKLVANLMNAVSKGSKVTKQLLAFSRSQRLDISANPLQASLLAARGLIGSSLGPGIDVQLRDGPPDTWVLVDPDQLELAVLNLALNARDAMPGGGVLTIESSIDTMPDRSPCALVKVTDTGVGMSEEVVAHAAEPFFTTKERGKGTGLGLAQVYGFVTQCRGVFRIVSVLGQGTCIELRFPLTVAPPAVADDAPPLEAEPRAPRKPVQILVVDDDDGVRAVIVQALTDAGFQVESASNGLSALSQLREAEPALAVIDFLMPGMNGAEVAGKARVLYPSMPIVFVSGYSDTVALDGIAGATVLRKPFDMLTLTTMVGAAVASSSA